MRREPRSRVRFHGAGWGRVGGRERTSSVGSKDLRRRGEDFSWEGRASEENKDAGVGVKEGVDKDGGNKAILSSIDSSERGAEEGKRKEGGSVEVDGSEGEGGEPLSLGDGKASGEPREERAAKEDFLPDGGDDQGVGEEREEGFGVAGFEKAG